MATQGLKIGVSCGSSGQQYRTSYLDFKLKRRRVSEIIASAELSPSCSDTDVQSTVSGDSGYGSPSDRVSKGKVQEQSAINVSDGDHVFNICKQEQKCVEDFLASIPKMDNQLIVPNVSTSGTGDVHIGVAYVTYTKNGIKPLTGLNGEVKMGLIPMLSSNKALYSLSLNGLSGISDGALPKGVQPLFLTSMPNGFEVPDLDSIQSLNNLMSESSGSKNTSSQSSKPLSQSSRRVMTIDSESEFIEHYTNGMFEYLGHLGDKRSCDSMSVSSHSSSYRSDSDSVYGKGSAATLTYDNKYPMVCGICNDRATGLHYGIITCEGCKGFFKRTVQNRRVYTCAGGGGECEINKAQRNRCQYCRFKKCLQAGMVLAAVREDRMPGGRNSGEVYNLYKVKYKKHRRRDETNISKERVACISSTDNQITVEPVKSRPKFENVLQVPYYSSASMVGLTNSTVSGGNFFSTQMGESMRTSHMSQASIESSFNMIYGGAPMESGTRVSMSTINPGEEQLYIEEQSPKRPRLESRRPGVMATHSMGMKAMSDNGGYRQGSWPGRLTAGATGPGHQYNEQSFWGENVPVVSAKPEIDTNGYCYEVETDFHKSDGRYEVETDSNKSDGRYAYFMNNTAGNHSAAISKDSTVCVRCSKEKNRHCVCSHVARLVNHHSVLRRTLTAPDIETEKHLSMVGSQLLPPPPVRTKTTKSDTFVRRCSSSLIAELMDCDAKLNIMDLYNLPELLNNGTTDVTKLLCDLGDKVVGKLVLWTKTLPFFKEIPVEVHSKLLSSKWQELLLFIATAHRAIYKESDVMNFKELYSLNMGKLKYYLEQVLKCEFKTGQLESDLGEIMQHITELMHGFVTMAILPEEYVCMLVLLFLNQDEDRLEIVSHFLEKYCMALRDFELSKDPNQASRFHELIKWVPKVQAASALLISSKMIHLPFFLNC
ncbi:uncharacterized protein LOC127837953 isoform X2 [Dreissena polymorpha]|uniref:Uncharacterized protein n=1 Tax=Dreissena polymorpha TaxID=45954 RepID=A0A9D4J3N9_DREPO|nr:uncharacterized protein LOC127837953 isoform X2 [Dreissena polymorpha]KAH3797225.1 hypothetical protein DPMN_150802 [Dreissena polymorpha]